MFFKRIKTKSSQKYLTTVLNSRTREFDFGKIKSVGVIFNYNNFHDYDFFRILFTDLGLISNRIRFIALMDHEKDRPNSWDSFFYKKDFDWLGHCNNIEVNEFVNLSLDLLISCYRPNCYELNIVTALSKAKLKVGLSTEDLRLHDLILDLDPKEKHTFRTELVKYLKTLNKI